MMNVRYFKRPVSDVKVLLIHALFILAADEGLAFLC